MMPRDTNDELASKTQVSARAAGPAVL